MEQGQYCTECGKDLTGWGLDRVFKHWAVEHYDTQLYRQVLGDVVVAIECDGCGETFETELIPDKHTPRTRSVCDDCADSIPLSSLLCKPIGCRKAIEREVNG